MLEATGGTTIKAPIGLVFAFLADARNEPKWLPGATNVVLESDEPVGMGSIFRGQYARAGTVTLQLTRFGPPNQLTIHGEGAHLAFDDEIELAFRDGQTDLRAVMRTQPKGVFRVLAPVMGRIIRRQFEDNWEQLKRSLESQGGAV